MFGKCTKEILDDLQNEVPPSENALARNMTTFECSLHANVTNT